MLQVPSVAVFFGWLDPPATRYRHRVQKARTYWTITLYITEKTAVRIVRSIKLHQKPEAHRAWKWCSPEFAVRVTPAPRFQNFVRGHVVFISFAASMFVVLNMVFDLRLWWQMQLTRCGEGFSDFLFLDAPPLSRDGCKKMAIWALCWPVKSQASWNRWVQLICQRRLDFPFMQQVW